MAEEEFELVEVDLDSIDLKKKKIERVYTAVAQLLIDNDVEKTPVGWTELFLVFLGLIAQMQLPDDACRLCVIDSIMHKLSRHFSSDAAEEGDGHAVH